MHVANIKIVFKTVNFIVLLVTQLQECWAESLDKYSY